MELSAARSLVKAAFGNVEDSKAKVVRESDFVEITIELTPELKAAFAATFGIKYGQRAAPELVIMTSLVEGGNNPPDVNDEFACWKFLPAVSREYWWGAVVGNFGDAAVRKKTKGRLFGPGRVFKKKKRITYAPGTLKLVAWEQAPVEEVGLYEFVFSVGSAGEDVSYICAGCDIF